MEIRTLTGREAIESGLAERILDLDRANMREVFDAAGIDFPEEKRRRGLGESTLIVAFDGESVAGYLGFQRSWRDPANLYIGSIQIEPRHRGGRLMLRLLDELRRRVADEDFARLETGVQKANTAAVRMYRKIGFTLEPNPENEASWIATAGRDLLTRSPVIAMLDRWSRRAPRNAG
ncbi:GNAT family N-acetyltransferase [Longimicrobium sp.]|uniref:GNAT family N-acetyltransferase n=1 Tax=Longimicrobium sp. TaxID=2029185 RepID=UPI002CD03EBF|nr:GNAT family N-acetyltransferase [Longimicrobium sp.]HSU14353.1 GNAT family N-acetyltransferase [Longimicrobium sp.]